VTITTPLCDALGVEHPVIQALIGSATRPELAAAVSNAGGLGTLAVTWRPPSGDRPGEGETVAEYPGGHPIERYGGPRRVAEERALDSSRLQKRRSPATYTGNKRRPPACPSTVASVVIKTTRATDIDRLHE